MAKAIAIELPENHSDVHRFRNFGEDIWRDLHDEYSIDLEEIDSATHVIHVSDIPNRDLRQVCQRIERIIKQHHYDGSASIRRL